MRTEVDDDSKIKNGLLGNEQAQEEAILKAYERYAKPLASYIRERVAPTLDSDELATVVSDAFCGLATRAKNGKFTTNGSLTTLLFRMARCKAIDTLRRKSARRRKAELEHLPTDADNESNADGFLDEEFAMRVV